MARNLSHVKDLEDSSIQSFSTLTHATQDHGYMGHRIASPKADLTLPSRCHKTGWGLCTTHMLTGHGQLCAPSAQNRAKLSSLWLQNQPEPRVLPEPEP